MGISMKSLAKYVGLPAGLVAGTSYIANSHPEVLNAMGTTIGAVDGVLKPMYETAVDALSQTPVVGSAAPFAFPMVAGGSLGYKLADFLKVENKVLKHATALTGAGLGFAASQSVAAPYLGIYGMYKTGKFLYDKQLVQRLFKGTLNPIMKVTEASKKMLVDPIIAIKKGLIDNSLEKPDYKY